MIDVSGAANFIRNHGNELDMARLNNTQGKTFDSNRVLSGFSEIQNPDGGFPYDDRPGFPSSLSNTAQAVHILLELGLRDSDITRSSIQFFLEMQHEGIFPENPKIAPLGPPIWDMPGDDRTTLWLTADITDLMLRIGRQKKELGSAGDFIMDHQAPDGKFMGYIHTTWMALSVFGENGLDEKEIFSNALTYLENADMEEWDAACMAWCLDCMKAGEVSQDSKLWQRILERLSELQEEDGGWLSDGGESHRTRDANAVLAALTDIAKYHKIIFGL